MESQIEIGIQQLKQSGDAIQFGGPHLCAGGKFPKPDGKARFRAVESPGDGQPGASRAFGVPPSGGASGLSGPLEGGIPNAHRQFRVTTRRGKQFNTLVYAEDDVRSP